MEKEKGFASYKTIVDYYSTSWDYVLTDVKLFDDYEKLEKHESEDK